MSTATYTVCLASPACCQALNVVLTSLDPATPPFSKPQMLTTSMLQPVVNFQMDAMTIWVLPCLHELQLSHDDAHTVTA